MRKVFSIACVCASGARMINANTPKVCVVGVGSDIPRSAKGTSVDKVIVYDKNNHGGMKSTPSYRKPRLSIGSIASATLLSSQNEKKNNPLYRQVEGRKSRKIK